VAAAAAICASVTWSHGRLSVTYNDEKVANRDIKVWHLLIKNGY
jgi:hypothetical protein